MYLIYNNFIYDISGLYSQDSSIYSIPSRIDKGEGKKLEEYSIGIISFNISQNIISQLDNKEQILMRGSQKKQSIKFFLRNKSLSYLNDQVYALRSVQDDLVKKVNSGIYFYRNSEEIYILSSININFQNMDKLTVVQDQDFVQNIEGLQTNTIQEFSYLNKYAIAYRNILEEHASQLVGQYRYFMGYLIQQEDIQSNYYNIQYGIQSKNSVNGRVLWNATDKQVDHYGFIGWIDDYCNSIIVESNQDQDQILFQKTVQTLQDENGNLALRTGDITRNRQSIQPITFTDMVDVYNNGISQEQYMVRLINLPKNIDTTSIFRILEPINKNFNELLNSKIYDNNNAKIAEFYLGADEFYRLANNFSSQIETQIQSQLMQLTQSTINSSIYKYLNDDNVYEYIPYEVFDEFLNSHAKQFFQEDILQPSSYLYSFLVTDLLDNNDMSSDLLQFLDNSYERFYGGVYEVTYDINDIINSNDTILNKNFNFDLHEYMKIYIYYSQLRNSYEYYCNIWPNNKSKQFYNFILNKFQFSLKLLSNNRKKGYYFIQQGDKDISEEKSIIEEGDFQFPQYYEGMQLDQAYTDINKVKQLSIKRVKGSRENKINTYGYQYQLVKKSEQDNVNLTYIYNKQPGSYSVDINWDHGVTSTKLFDYYMKLSDNGEISNISFNVQNNFINEMNFPGFQILQYSKDAKSVQDQLFNMKNGTEEELTKYLEDNFYLVQIPILGYDVSSITEPLSVTLSAFNMDNNYPQMFNKYEKYNPNIHSSKVENQQDIKRYAILSLPNYQYNGQQYIEYEYQDKTVTDITPFLLNSIIDTSNQNISVYVSTWLLKELDKKLLFENNDTLNSLIIGEKIFKYSDQYNNNIITFMDHDKFKLQDNDISQKNSGELFLQEYMEQLNEEYRYILKNILDDADIFKNNNRQLYINKNYINRFDIIHDRNLNAELRQPDPNNKYESYQVVNIDKGQMYNINYQLADAIQEDGLTLIRVLEFGG